LWCKGGEEKFVENMIRQSKLFQSNCLWFSTSISKQSHLKSIYDALERAEAIEVKTIPMGQGNKSGRIVAWTFFEAEDKKEWINMRWNGIILD
jgi:23S rRNA (adenine1618-N6)-methyltransferase